MCQRRSEVAEDFSIFTPGALEEAEKSGKLDIDSNFLDLRPDPAHFVGFLKMVNRPEVSSSLFVRLLEAYRRVKSDGEGDPLRYAVILSLVSFCPYVLRRTLLYLQLVMQIQAQLTDASPSTNILKKPEHILMFVKHALEDAQMSGVPKSPGGRPKRAGLGLDDLRIVPDSGDEDEIGSRDSDDEDEDSVNVAPDEITVTTLNLLLALLEGELFRRLAQPLYSYWDLSQL